jgi:hypothetical protein
MMTASPGSAILPQRRSNNSEAASHRVPGSDFMPTRTRYPMSSTTAPDADFAWLDAELAALRDLDAQAIKKGSALDKGNALLKALRSRCGFPSMDSVEEIPLAEFDETSILPRAENLTPLQRRMVVGLMDLERIHEEPLQDGIEDCDDDDLAAVLAEGLKLEPPKAAKGASGKRSARANRSK